MMNMSGNSLRDEARRKFSPYWKKFADIGDKVKYILHMPMRLLRKKFPGIPTKAQLKEKIARFSLTKFVLQAGQKLARHANNDEVEQFFTNRLEALNEVKDHIIVRYIMKELFLYFIVSFLFFFMIFFVNQILLLAEMILKQRVPVFTVIRLIWYNLPAIIAQSAPFATLVGFLMCIGRMVTDNEVLILRASGQRYMSVLKPVLVMGILISVMSFLVNDYFLPLGIIKYNQLYRQVITSNPTVELEPHSIKRTNNSILVIGDVDKKHVSDLVFFDTTNNGNQRLIIAKDTNVYNAKQPGVIMQLDMNDSLVVQFQQEKTDFDVLDAKNMKLNIFESAILAASNGTSPREMTSFDLLKTIKKMQRQPNMKKSQLNTYKLEYNKKFSIPFGSFFFALLALPLALIFGKKDGQTLGLIFGLIISVLYWAATIIGQLFGIRSGYNGFVMMWLPNLIIGALGILLYVKLVKK